MTIAIRNPGLGLGWVYQDLSTFSPPLETLTSVSKFQHIFPPIRNPDIGWVYQDSSKFPHPLETLALGGCIKIQAHFPTHWKHSSWVGVSRFKHIFPHIGNPRLGWVYQNSSTFSYTLETLVLDGCIKIQAHFSLSTQLINKLTMYKLWPFVLDM